MTLKTGNVDRRSVSIVIPTHNNLHLLRECLDGVRDLKYPSASLGVVVVNNASTDGTPSVLHEHYPQVKLVNLEKNTGFAEACNRGAAAASEEYVAFLNDDAVPDKDWLLGLFAGLDAGGKGTVCAASHIRSRDGEQVEFEGASANLFGVGRPRSAWGWPDAPNKPGEGDLLLFASGGAMLIHRRTFLDVGGFDPQFFAYFEDVDLGWRLWVLGHKVAYAPRARVRHVGGATGSRQPEHRRYTLWECNALATVLKNYEGGHMERVLSAAIMLQLRRALLSAGEAFQPGEYKLTAPRDTNTANIERLPKVSVAHLAAVARFNERLPHFMRERRRIQAERKRPDREILPLLGRPWEMGFAGAEYADKARTLFAALDLYGITRETAPNRVLVLASTEEEGEAIRVAEQLKDNTLVAVAIVTKQPGGKTTRPPQQGFTLHTLREGDPRLGELAGQADALVVLPGVAQLSILRETATPIASIGGKGATLPRASAFEMGDWDRLVAFCQAPQAGTIT